MNVFDFSKIDPIFYCVGKNRMKIFHSFFLALNAKIDLIRIKIGHVKNRFYRIVVYTKALFFRIYFIALNALFSVLFLLVGRRLNEIKLNRQRRLFGN